MITCPEKKLKDHIEWNFNLISSFGKKAHKNLLKVLDGCSVIGKIELVNKPQGERESNNCSMYKNIHLHQWYNGLDGDSFAGDIYANVKGQWIKIPYAN